MTADVYNLKNEKIGTAELPESVFGVKWNPVLVKQAITAQLANARIPWAHTKTRGEVRGGGKKPWRQKGTGRARHGSTRSPIWVGGGVTHGPRNERDYSQSINKKMKRLALFSALSRKFKDGEIKVVESFALEAPKARILASSLNGLLEMKKGAKRYDVLLIPAKTDQTLYRASSNLQKTKTVSADSLNVNDIMNYGTILLEQPAAETIVKHYQR